MACKDRSFCETVLFQQEFLYIFHPYASEIILNISFDEQFPPYELRMVY